MGAADRARVGGGTKWRREEREERERGERERREMRVCVVQKQQKADDPPAADTHTHNDRVYTCV